MTDGHLENRNAATAQANLRRNFVGALWHGAFLAVGTALTQPTTVIAAFVAELTGSTIWVGGLVTVLTVAGALPQIFVARWIEPRRYKMPILLLAIYLRVASWALLAWLIFVLGPDRPQLLAWALVGVLAVFYACGGLGGVPYTDIIGKIIPPGRRGAFFGGRQALAGPLAVGAAFLARRVLATVVYPTNYALLFGVAAVGLFVASFGLWLIREPPHVEAKRQAIAWRRYAGMLKGAVGDLKQLVAVQVLTGFSLMAFPFYIVYARHDLGAPAEALGWFILMQVLGGVLANLVWARLVDRYGSKRMVMVCAAISTLTPLLAIGLSRFGWQGMLPVLFLVGAIIAGRSVGFNSALLELAPAAQRPTYSALDAMLILPVAFLSLVGGILLQHWSYAALFGMVSCFVGAGALLTQWLPSIGREGTSGT